MAVPAAPAQPQEDLAVSALSGVARVVVGIATLWFLVALAIVIAAGIIAARDRRKRR